MKKHVAIKQVLLALVFALCGQVHALGSGSISDGSGSISKNGHTTTVEQSSDKLIINWDNMNVGKAETLNFKQKDANAAVLNRINSIDPTTILGALNANGRVFIVNPNGVLIGNGAQVNVGSLVASALDISDAGFKSDVLSFAGGEGRVRNQGEINATGSVALIGAAGVENMGAIKAAGDVVLAAADAVSLNFAGNNLQAKLSQASLAAMVNNGGLIVTQDGGIALTAWARDAITRSVINNSGSLEANRVSRAGGAIRLASLGSGTLDIGGVLAAASDIAAHGQGIHVQDGSRLSVADGNIDLAARGAEGTAAYVKFGGAELTAYELNITADNVATAAAGLPRLQVDDVNVTAASVDRHLLVGGTLPADQAAILHNGKGVISDGFITAAEGLELSVSTKGLGQLVLDNHKLNYGALALRAERGDIRFDSHVHADRIDATTGGAIEQAEAADIIVDNALLLSAKGSLNQRANMLAGEYGRISLGGGASMTQQRGTQARAEDIFYGGDRLVLSGATNSSDALTIYGGSEFILLDGELRSYSLQLNARGDVKQSGRASINAEVVGLVGAAANFDLSAGKNAIGRLSISQANSVNVVVTDDLSLATLRTAGDLKIRSEKGLETSNGYAVFAGGKLDLEAGERLLLGGQMTAVRHASLAAGQLGIDVPGQLHVGSATMRTQGDITQREGSLVDVVGNLDYKLGSQSKVVMMQGASRNVGGKISGLPVEPLPKPPKPWWAWWMWWW